MYVYIYFLADIKIFGYTPEDISNSNISSRDVSAIVLTLRAIGLR